MTVAETREQVLARHPNAELDFKDEVQALIERWWFVGTDSMIRTFEEKLREIREAERDAA